MPTRPSDLPYDVSLRALAELHARHAGRLVDARHGIGEPPAAVEVVGHALAALASQHALAERALWSRWCSVRDALAAGATVEQVAAACALDPVEVAVGLRTWADGQVSIGSMTAAEAGAVRALVDGW